MVELPVYDQWLVVEIEGKREGMRMLGPSGIIIENSTPLLYAYTSMLKLLLSTSSEYKEQIACSTNAYYPDKHLDFDDATAANQGWVAHQKLIEGSAIVSLISDLPLDMSNSFKVKVFPTVTRCVVCTVFYVFVLAFPPSTEIQLGLTHAPGGYLITRGGCRVSVTYCCIMYVHTYVQK